MDDEPVKMAAANLAMATPMLASNAAFTAAPAWDGAAVVDGTSSSDDGNRSMEWLLVVIIPGYITGPCVRGRHIITWSGPPGSQRAHDGGGRGRAVSYG